MIKLVGIITALVGAAHFFVPEQFRAVTQMAFPENTDEAIKQNGAIETAIGTALVMPRTRTVGFLGLAGYVGWLGFNFVRNQ